MRRYVGASSPVLREMLVTGGRAATLVIIAGRLPDDGTPTRQVYPRSRHQSQSKSLLVRSRGKQSRRQAWDEHPQLNVTREAREQPRSPDDVNSAVQIELVLNSPAGSLKEHLSLSPMLAKNS